MAPFYVCAKCQSKYVAHATGTEMRPEKNGVYVIEMADFGPYKVWLADLWICPVCKHKVIAGFGLNPISEHYMDGFGKILETAQASLSVYYC